MNSLVRIGLRFITLILTLSIVVFVLVGGFWYMWQNAKGQAPQVSFTITAERLERTAMGTYLRLRYGEGALDRAARPEDHQEVTFVVEPGESVYSVAYNLKQMGLVEDAELFRRASQYLGADKDIQVGVYTLRPSMTVQEIIRELQHGRLPTVTVTIPEGKRMEEVAELLEQAGVTSAEEFLRVANQPRTDMPFLTDRPAGSPLHLEGFLFPDTYEMPKDAPAERVIEIMLQNWDRRVSPELRAKAVETGKTLYEIITLASIVEREAVLPEERALIAGVFWNRLNRGMYLQADPTVSYVKGYDEGQQRWWPGMLLEEASTINSPYNTYLNPGLPPGPICSPGLAAIQATIEPAKTDYLFFRTRGDGSHVFAVTYEEHLRNQELYGDK
ncbi:MAG: endolytic transglycosylase MltG [Chloroflexi bacterium]|nr:endolytic transglycosylase MltG [Chloroflexota bacterium]